MSANIITSISDLDALATRLFKAGLFGNDVKNVDQAFAVLLTGWELDLPPMVSLRGILFSRGKVSLSAELTVAVCVKRRDVCSYFRLVASTPTEATYETLRAGSPAPNTLTWTIAQAQRAGLMSNAVWKNHPEAMLRARCAAALARATYPDLVAKLYDPDEVAEINRNDGPAAAPPPAAEEAPRSSPLTGWRGDLFDCTTLADVVACWHLHAQALHAAEVTDEASADVGDWLGENGYCVTATEQQLILSRVWPEDAMRLADELAHLAGRMSTVQWYVGVRAKVDAVPRPAQDHLKRLIARTWAVRSEVDATRPGKAFAAAVEAFERRDEAPPAEPEPIVTSKGATLRSADEVATHVRGIKVVAHLESAARKHGAHPWASGPLAERAEELLSVPLDAARAQVAAWAAEGPRVAPVPPELAEFYARVPEIELPGEGVAVWMKHKDALDAVAKDANDAAWVALCGRVAEVGKMKSGGAAARWMKKAVEEELARRGVRP